MMIDRVRSLVYGVVLLGAFGSAQSLQAQIGVGTWVRAAKASLPGMTMTVEACCNGGRRLIYRLDINGTETILALESRLDGSDAPVVVGGTPSGQTMALKRIDDYHMSAVLKLNGKVFATSKTTLSADGKTLTVINEYTSPVAGQPTGKVTEVWVRK